MRLAKIVLRERAANPVGRLLRLGQPSDRGQTIPDEGAQRIRLLEAKPPLMTPAKRHLRPGMPLERRTLVPFKGTDLVRLDPKTPAIKHGHDLFGVRIARAQSGGQLFQRLIELTRPDQRPRLAQTCLSILRTEQKHQRSANPAPQPQRCGDPAPAGPKPWRPGRLHLALAFLGLMSGGAGAQEITPDDFLSFDPAQARIGQLLFYDKILSGNRNISCATCHHHDLGGTDRLSLGIGEGGEGLGPARRAISGRARVARRIPRNAPGLWNLGHRDVAVLFHDGRLSRSERFVSGFASPAGDHLPEGLNSIIAAQALFPMTAEFEMAGNVGENPLADAVAGGVHLGWPIIAERVRGIPAYATLFIAAFPDVSTAQDISIVEIANALAAFIGTEWQSYDSPYDAYLAGIAPLPEEAARGETLFFGEAGCAACHSGPLFSDQDFHAMGLPGFGPGRTRLHDPIPRDIGRLAVTDRPEDAYRFRTLPLRNVALTAPYGHNGAYPTLRGIIRHMANPVGERLRWEPRLAHLPSADWLHDYDFVLLEDRLETARQVETIETRRVALTDDDVTVLEAFLNALTGESALTRPLGRPDRVPSGLSVD